MMMKTKFKKTEIGMIPEDWEVKDFEHICEKIIDCSHAKKPDFLNEGEYIYLEVSNIGNDGFLDLAETRFVSKEDFNAWTKRLIPREGDIVITKTGRVGASSIIPKNIDCCIGRNQVILRANKKIVSPHFLWHFLHSDIFKNELKKQTMTGTILESLHVKYISKLQIAVPKISEQEEISGFLDSLSYKIKLLQKQNETLEKIGKTIFKHWFVDFEFPNDEGKPYKSSGGEMIYNEELGKEIPKGWKVSTIGKELKTVLGGTPSRIKKEYWDCGTVPWINSGAINEFPIMNPTQFITKEGLDNSAAKLMLKGTIVLPFVISVGKEVKISILGIESSGNQSVLGILENEKFSSGYIYHWIQIKKQKLYLSATGGAQQHINKREVDSLELLIPSNLLLDTFNVFSKKIIKKIISNAEQVQSLQKTRGLLLPKLMTGKIRVPREVEK